MDNHIGYRIAGTIGYPKKLIAQWLSKKSITEIWRSHRVKCMIRCKFYGAESKQVRIDLPLLNFGLVSTIIASGYANKFNGRAENIVFPLSQICRLDIVH